MAALAITGAALFAGTSNAFALECVNASRPAPTQPSAPLMDASALNGPVIWVVQGNWWFVSDGLDFEAGYWDFVPPGTAVWLGMDQEAATSLGLSAGSVHGDFQAGEGFGLLDNAQAPCNEERQTSHGIQGESMRCAG